MNVAVHNPDWSVTAMGAGVGLWVFFGWCLITARRGQRLWLVAVFGLTAAASFAGAFGWARLAGDGGLSSLGAMGGAAVAVVGAVRPWHRENRRLLDRLIPGGLAGLAVARAGCLFDGCDFGRVTEFWPSVVHEATTPAWQVHVAEYGLAPQSDYTLSVHPFALYLAVWGLVSALFGEWLRRRHTGPGAAAMASAALFFAGGGMIEWLREPTTALQLGDGILVYPWVYWSAAVATMWAWRWCWRRGDGRDE